MEDVRENATPSRTLLILKTHTHTHSLRQKGAVIILILQLIN